MSRFIAMSAVFCGLMLALPGGRPIEAEDRPSDKQPPSAVNEIKQQIESRGGSLLRGTSFAPAEGEVDEVLHREQRLRLAQQSAVVDPGSSVAPPVVATPGEASPADQARLLRQAARQLEEVAHHLEELALYEQADQLREQAQQFRVQSRSLLSTRAPRAVVR